MSKKGTKQEKKSKICAQCGRAFEFRKKWKDNWDEVKFCSDACRKKKKAPDYRAGILELLSQRDAGKTICPSELLSQEDKTNKEMMERVRQSARLLVNEGKIEITQGGKVVDPSDFKGPIRLRLKRS